MTRTSAGGAVWARALSTASATRAAELKVGMMTLTDGRCMVDPFPIDKRLLLAALLLCQGLHHPRRAPRHQHVRGDVPGHYRAGGDDGPVADGHALHDHGVGPDPDVVAEHDRADGVRRHRLLGPPPGRVERVAVKVAHDHAGSEQAVPADAHRVGDRDATAVADE